MDADCPLFYHSDSVNANRSKSDQGLQHEIAARGSELFITEQYASLGKEKRDNTPILLHFQIDVYLFATKNEISSMHFRKRIHVNSLACLQLGGTPSHLNTYVHATHDSGPDLDPLIAHRAIKMIENEEKMQFYLLSENSPALFCQEAFGNDQTGIGPDRYRDKMLRTPEVSACLTAGSEGNGLENYRRNRLRRLQNAINLNQDNSTEVWVWRNYQLDRECPSSDHSDLKNASFSKADPGLNHVILAKGKPLSITEPQASFSQELRKNFPVLPQFKNDFSHIFTKNENSKMPLLTKIESEWSNIFNFYGILTTMNTYLKTNHVSRPHIDSRIFQNSAKIVKNEEEMQIFYLREILLTQILQELYYIQLTDRRLVPQQKNVVISTEYAPCQSASSEVNGIQVSPRSRLRRLQTVPGSPSTITVLSKTSSSIQFSWNPPANNGGSPITSYTIRWWLDNVGWQENFGSTSSTNYTVNQLMPNHQYWWFVYANNSVGPGSLSPEQTAFTNSGTVPASPAGLTLVKATVSCLGLSWNAPNDGGQTITNYEIEQYNNNLLTWQLKGSSSTTSYTASGLLLSTQYQFRVRASNSNGWGDYSQIISTMTSSIMTAPDPPTLQFVNYYGTPTSNTFYWLNQVCDGGSFIEEYQIFWKDQNNNWTLCNQGKYSYWEYNYYTITGLMASTSYWFYAVAVNSVGKSSQSNELQISTTATSSCFLSYDTAFIQLPINYIIGSSAVMYSIPTYTLQNGCAPTANNCRASCMRQNNQLTMFMTSCNMSSRQGSIYLTNTSLAGSYMCTVCPDIGRSNMAFQFSLILLTVPDPPTNLTKISTFLTSVAFQWTAPVNNGGSIVLSYFIYWDQGTGNWVICNANYSNGISYSLDGLRASTTYKFKLAATNIAGSSTFTSDFAISTTAASVPDPPTALTAITASITQTQLAFSWIAPANDGGNPVTGYEIWWDQESSNWIKIVASQTTTFFTQTGFTAKNNSFKVAAINSIGVSIFSNKITLGTLNNLPYFSYELKSSYQIQMTTVSTSWSMALPEIIDLDADDVVKLTVDFGSAANFLQLNGVSSIDCLDIKKGGQSNIRSEKYLIKLILDDKRDKVTVQFNLFVFEPPFDTLTHEPLSTDSKSDQTTLKDSVKENDMQQDQPSDQSIQNLSNVIITNEMSTEKKQQVLDKLSFDWQQGFAKLRARQKDKNTQAIQQKIPPNPYIKEVTQQGKLEVRFSSEINIVPNLQLLNNGTIYLDQLSLDSDLKEKIKPKRLLKERVPVLLVNVIPGIQSNLSDLLFIWNVTQQNAKSLEIQLYFQTPLKVSQYSVSINFVSYTQFNLGF